MAAIASPCTGVCAIDEATDLCRGCARTMDEIAAWAVMGDAARARIMAALPGRAATFDPSAAARG